MSVPLTSSPSWPSIRVSQFSPVNWRQAGDYRMQDHLTTADHYRAKAAECQRLAAITRDHNLKAGFARVAELYLQLAIAELYLQVTDNPASVVAKESDGLPRL